MIELPPQFWRYVDISDGDGCWKWLAGHKRGGYPHFANNGKVRPTDCAHRLSYLALIGDIPPGMELHHLCNNPECLNPWHLTPVTPLENKSEVNSTKTHCPYGHEYNATNTIKRKDGGRECRACVYARNRIYKRRLRGYYLKHPERKTTDRRVLIKLDPVIPKPLPTGRIELPWRFWLYVNKQGPNGCWIWTGHRQRNGYGGFGNALSVRPTKLVHRLAYLALIGDIPKGLVLHHICQNPPCLNPAHLEPVTQKTNVLQNPDHWLSRQVATVACPQGHAYTVENTYIPARGGRNCRICRREALRQYNGYYLRHPDEVPSGTL